MQDVHDLIPKLEEPFRRQRLSKEVRDVVTCLDIWYDNAPILDSLTNEEMPALDVFGAVMQLRVIS